MANCQRLRFTTFSAPPDWPDSVNDEARRQTVPASNLRFAGFTTAEHPAFGQQLGAGCPMNRAIHAATAEERSVCRVHDCVDLQLCDVAPDDLNPAIWIFIHSLSAVKGRNNLRFFAPLRMTMMLNVLTLQRFNISTSGSHSHGASRAMSQ